MWISTGRCPSRMGRRPATGMSTPATTSTIPARISARPSGILLQYRDLAESRLQRGIQPLVDLVCASIEGGIGGARLLAIHLADGGAANLLHRTVGARSGQRQQGRAIGRAFLGFQPDHAPIEYVRQQAAPEGALRAAAGSAHGVDGDAQTLDDVQAIALAVGDALDHGADEIGAGVA